MKRRSASALICAALIAAMAFPATGADKKDSKEREALRRVQQNAAKLQSEKAALEGEKAELAQKLDAATKALSGVRGEASAARRRAQAAEGELPPLRSETADLKTRLDAALKSLAESEKRAAEDSQTAMQNQKRLETIVANLRLTLGKESDEGKACATRNQELVALSRRMLRQASVSRSCLDALVPEAPGRGFPEVSVENMLQDYEDKVRGSTVRAPQ
jgi:chromosome segregation ATPase